MSGLAQQNVRPGSLMAAMPDRATLRKKAIRQWVSLVLLLVQRDLRVRYRGSVLGYMWSMMNPLLYMLILSFVFSHLTKFELKNFPMFILSGILAWNLFAQGLGLGVHSIVANGALLRKVKVPATIFPAAGVCSCLVNFLLALVPFVLIGAVTGLDFSWWTLFLPVVLLPYLLFIFGLSLGVASLNVSFRDVGHTMEPILQIVYFASPIFYPIESLPAKYQTILSFNPMVHYVGEIRNLLYAGAPPHLARVALLYGMAFASLAVGGFIYKKMRNGFVYNV